MQTNRNFVAKLGIVMTEEQEIQFGEFETRLYGLINLCDEFKQKIADLTASLQMEEATNEVLNAKIANLEKQYSDLKTATAISLRNGDVRESKERINILVREIDKCIALLND